MRTRSGAGFKPVLERVETRALMSVFAAPSGGRAEVAKPDQPKVPYTAWVKFTLADSANNPAKLNFDLIASPGSGRAEPKTINKGQTKPYKTDSGTGAHKFVFIVKAGIRVDTKVDIPVPSDASGTNFRLESTAPTYEIAYVGPGNKYTLEPV
jgi:hypothetical protein